MHYSVISTGLCAFFLCLPITGPASGGSTQECEANETSKLLPADVAPGDQFGIDTVIRGSALFVSAAKDDGTGAVYVYRFNPCAMSWSLEAKLTAPDGVPGDEFAILGASGPIIAIGSWLDDDNGADSGSAYVFRYDGLSWSQEQKLTADDGEADDHFGLTITAYGDTVIVGAPGEDEQGANAGAAYVFEYDGTTWIQRAKLVASDGAPGDGFGYPVVTRNGVLLVGAYGDDDFGDNAGSAYVFRYNGTAWVEEVKLTASDGAEGDLFGIWAAIDEEVIVIGAPGDDDAGDSAGAAYVFRYQAGNWIEEDKLVGSDSAAGDQFGAVVAVSEELILVTAWRHDGVDTDSGAVYAYEFDGASWNEVANVTASDAGAGYVFGNSVAIDEGVAVIGSKFHDGAGVDAGAAYVVAGLGDCNDNGVLDICDIAGGASFDLNGNGIPDECEGLSCPADVNGDGVVNIDDIFEVLGQWGPCQ